jgi:hypothetical protein
MMIYDAQQDIGFFKAYFPKLENNLINKKRDDIYTIPLGRFLSILSNYAIPFEVAPQQSFSPLYVTVNSKLRNKKSKTKIIFKKCKTIFKLFN